MSVEQLRMISAAGYLASGILIVVTVILFFVFKIPQLVRDITGVTARRAIEDIRRQNEEDGKGGSHVVMRKRGWSHHTGQMTPSGKMQDMFNGTSGPSGAKKSEKIGMTGAMVKKKAKGTIVPVQEGIGEGTTVLAQGKIGEETTILAGTTVLHQMPQEVAQQTSIQKVRSEPLMGGSTEELFRVSQAPASVVVQVDIGFSESPETVD